MRPLVFGHGASVGRQPDQLKGTDMSKVCELSGKGPMTGNNVSHAQNKTRRRFLPNLVQATLLSDALGKSFRFKVAAATLRTVEHRDGLDNHLLKTADADLSTRALAVKKEVKAALEAKSAA